MLGITKDNPLRDELIGLISSINHEIGLSEENQVLLVIKLDTEDKIFEFTDWVKTRIENGKFVATEAETMRKAVQISKRLQ